MTAPLLIETRVFARLPDEFRGRRQASPWGDEPRPGRQFDCFLEGPSFDAEGNLWVVDIPHGRIFRISPAGDWDLRVEYEGEPNGLKFHPDGRILIADYRNGIVELDPVNGKVRPFLARANLESFKGCNDLYVTGDGELFFTDRGQSGMNDPTGRVFHLSAGRRLTCLISNGVSPNGILYSQTENALYVAMTRDNAVWRAPLTEERRITKAGRFCSLSGRGGPDGLAMDEAGNLLAAQVWAGAVYGFDEYGEVVAKVRSCAGNAITNMAYGGPDRKRLYMTESATGQILVADMPHPGVKLPG
jgi:gluconolactonase